MAPRPSGAQSIWQSLRTAAVSQTSRSNVRTFRTVQVFLEPPDRATFLRLAFQAQSRS